MPDGEQQAMVDFHVHLSLSDVADHKSVRFDWSLWFLQHACCFLQLTLDLAIVSLGVRIDEVETDCDSS